MEQRRTLKGFELHQALSKREETSGFMQSEATILHEMQHCISDAVELVQRHGSDAVDKASAIIAVEGDTGVFQLQYDGNPFVGTGASALAPAVDEYTARKALALNDASELFDGCSTQDIEVFKRFSPDLKQVIHAGLTARYYLQGLEKSVLADIEQLIELHHNEVPLRLLINDKRLKAASTKASKKLNQIIKSLDPAVQFRKQDRLAQINYILRKNPT